MKLYIIFILITLILNTLVYTVKLDKTKPSISAIITIVINMILILYSIAVLTLTLKH